MNAERISVAKACLDAAHDGSLSFPQIVGELIDAGFEGYTVDYRRNCQSYYTPEGDSLVLDMGPSTAAVAPVFDEAGVEALVRWAQTGPADYSYRSFSEKVKAAGCAGYLVSFSGKRVVYFGRTAETHVEHFPN